MIYLMEKEQSIDECTLYTLKNLLNHSLEQNWYKNSRNDSIEIYSKP
jgi:hypothetical protein